MKLLNLFSTGSIYMYLRCKNKVIVLNSLEINESTFNIIQQRAYKYKIQKKEYQRKKAYNIYCNTK